MLGPLGRYQTRSQVNRVFADTRENDGGKRKFERFTRNKLKVIPSPRSGLIDLSKRTTISLSFFSKDSILCRVGRANRRTEDGFVGPQRKVRSRRLRKKMVTSLFNQGTVAEGHNFRWAMKLLRQFESDGRMSICRAHSATHILHYALQQNLGQHAQQPRIESFRRSLAIRFFKQGTDNGRATGLPLNYKRLGESQAPNQSRRKTLPLESAREQGADDVCLVRNIPTRFEWFPIGEFQQGALWRHASAEF